MFSVLAVNFKMVVEVERAVLAKMEIAVRRKIEQT